MKTIHMSMFVDPAGAVSALCFKNPRAIDATRATWTSSAAKVTCGACVVALRNGADADETVHQLSQSLPPPPDSPARIGSDEHRAKMRQAQLDRHASRRARGEPGRHPAMKAPTFTPKRRHACDDPGRFSSLPPTRSSLHGGPTATELIAWAAARRRGG